MVGDRRVVTVEYIAQITADAPVPAHWPRLPDGINGAIALIVEGRPSYRALLLSDPMPGERLHASIPMTALGGDERDPGRGRGPSRTPVADRPTVLRDPPRRLTWRRERCPRNDPTTT